jgi:hypothetical protein
MAQSGHNNSCSECPLLGAKQTSHAPVTMFANDPKQTCSLNSCVCISYALSCKGLPISGTLYSEVCLRVVSLAPCTVVVVL